MADKEKEVEVTKISIMLCEQMEEAIHIIR